MYVFKEQDYSQYSITGTEIVYRAVQAECLNVVQGLIKHAPSRRTLLKRTLVVTDTLPEYVDMWEQVPTFISATKCTILITYKY